jgi:hypothetical protein
MGFHETIGRLVSRRGSDNIGAVINQVLRNCRAKKYGITVTTETSSTQPSVCPEKTESQENQLLGEVLETKDPVVPSGPVDENQRVMKLAHQDTVAEGNVDMDELRKNDFSRSIEPPRGAFGIVV